MREHRPVIALDFPSFEAVKEFLALFPAEESLYLKVGMELYYATGPEIVSYLKGLGHSVFLDLKLHDIPNTVKSAMKVLSQLGVDMTNVHAAGGTGGTRSNKLLPSQIPALNTDNLVLEKATNGDVIVGQCQEDPDTNGPGYKKYNEVRANVGAQKGENNTVNNLMPYITVHLWVRVQ